MKDAFSDVSDRSSGDVSFVSGARSPEGFVLPPKWDPWPTALRVDPFRRRYERQILQTNLAESRKKTKRRRRYADAFGTSGSQTFPFRRRRTPQRLTEVVFDEMYPDREDVDALGDDVRVGPRRAFKGAISWKTERDEKASSSVRLFSVFPTFSVILIQPTMVLVRACRDDRVPRTQPRIQVRELTRDGSPRPPLRNAALRVLLPGPRLGLARTSRRACCRRWRRV